MALHDLDFFEVIGAFYALDADSAMDELSACPPSCWTGLAYEWKSDNASEYHQFIQYVVDVLPSHAPMGWVFSLVEEYLHPIVHLPDAVDIAAETLVRFWNAHLECRTADNERELRDYLRLLDDHPDSERVPDIARQITPR
ncbi:hypothetical protein KBX10_06555 [Corynebacterium sp. CCUG 59401]|nr:hypothetical protein [Corynebacterium pseudogenitalium]